MRQVYTHNELEVVMTRLGWKPLVKRGAWRRFYKRADYTRAHGVASMATIARLPSRSFVDAPKHIILDFVKTVNRRENRNVLCCWWVLHLISSHSVPLPVSMHAGCHYLWTQLRQKQVYTFFCVSGLVNRFSQDWDFATESGHGQVLGNFFIMQVWNFGSCELNLSWYHMCVFTCREHRGQLPILGWEQVLLHWGVCSVFFSSMPIITILTFKPWVPKLEGRRHLAFLIAHLFADLHA